MEVYENTVPGLMSLLEEKWKIAERAAIAAEVSPAVLRHRRRAFYDGAKTILEEFATRDDLDDTTVDVMLGAIDQIKKKLK